MVGGNGEEEVPPAEGLAAQHLQGPIQGLDDPDLLFRPSAVGRIVGRLGVDVDEVVVR